MIFPGTDFSTFLTDINGTIVSSDMDTSFSPIGGAAVCLETILRKLMSPPESYDDTSWGLDLRGRLNLSMSSADLSALSAQVRAACLEEEYVDDATVVCTLGGDGTLSLIITLSLADLQVYRLAFVLSATGIQVILDVGQTA